MKVDRQLNKGLISPSKVATIHQVITNTHNQLGNASFKIIRINNPEKTTLKPNTKLNAFHVLYTQSEQEQSLLYLVTQEAQIYLIQNLAEIINITNKDLNITNNEYKQIMKYKPFETTHKKITKMITYTNQ